MSDDPNLIRISADDRARVENLIREAFVDGRINTAELEQRLKSLATSKYSSDLEPLIADLPTPKANQIEKIVAETGKSFMSSLRTPLLIPPVLCTVIWLMTTPRRLLLANVGLVRCRHCCPARVHEQGLALLRTPRGDGVGRSATGSRARHEHMDCRA